MVFIDQKKLLEELLSKKSGSMLLLDWNAVEDHIVDKIKDILSSGQHFLLDNPEALQSEISAFFELTQDTKKFPKFDVPNFTDKTLKQIFWRFSGVSMSSLRNPNDSFTVEDVLALKSSLPLFDNPAFIVRGLNLDEHRLSIHYGHALESGRNTVLLQKEMWTERELAAFFIAGAQFDDIPTSVFFYENLPDSVKYNPVICGVNVTQSSSHYNDKYTTNLPHADRDMAYGHNGLLHIIQVVASDRFRALSMEKMEGVDERGEPVIPTNTYINSVEELISLVLPLSHKDYEAGALLDSEALTVQRLLIKTASSIDELAKLVDAKIAQSFSLSAQEFEFKKVSIEEVLKDALMESHFYHDSFKALNDMAKDVLSIVNSNEQKNSAAIRNFASAALRTFTCLVSMDYRYDLSSKDEKTRIQQVVLAEALLGMDLNAFKDIAHKLVSFYESGHDVSWNEVHRFIHHAPISLVESVMLSITNPNTMEKALSNFMERCQNNQRYLAQNFTNRHANAIADIFAHAEQVSPGIGKRYVVNDALKRFWCDQGYTYQRYLNNVTQEVIASVESIDAPTSDDAVDMGFLAPTSLKI